MGTPLRRSTKWIVVGLVLATHARDAAGIEFGMYGLHPSDGREIELVASKGFRLAIVPANGADLDALHAVGMKGLVAFWLRKSDLESKESWIAFEARVRRAIRTLATHPALFGWYVSDEPDGQRIPVANVRAACDLIRSMDAKTPLFAVFDDPSRWAEYLPLFDIVAVDPYLRLQASGGYASTTVVSTWLAAVRKSLSEQRTTPAVWVVLGAFELRPKNSREPSRYKRPTPDEFRLMANAAVAAGVGGILVYSYSITERPDTRSWSLPDDDPALWAVVGSLPTLSFH